MKALSIHQPWAWAIVNAGKDIENRSWSTRYRGPVLIHASKGMKVSDWDAFMDLLAQQFPGKHLPLSFPLWNEFERGGIVGKARVVDCVRSSPSPWFFGPYGFVLADVEPVTFQPCKGALGFFNVEAG